MTHPSKALFTLLPLLALWLPAGLAVADEGHAPAKDEYAEELQRFVPGANRIEGMIRAPCCMTSSKQTLDIHGSEVANALRREIRRRLLAGESEEAIVASLVNRYGQEVIAVPPGSPLKGVAMVLTTIMAAAGVAAFFMLRRWRARGTAAPPERKASADAKKSDVDYDARLDAELRALDD